jgi:hypothetical protein
LLATEEYAEKTGKECTSCHVDPSGGVELTDEGKQFQKKLESGNDEINLVSSSISMLRFISGYLHILTAIFWFGTILYVHLVLKPAYAAGGLPKSEVRVGLASMGIMLVTGIILTASIRQIGTKSSMIWQIPNKSPIPNCKFYVHYVQKYVHRFIKYL